LEFKTICVLGLGYIGLPTASTFATHGVQVIGVDVNKRVVEILQNGDVHIHEPGLRTLVQAAVKSKNLVIQDAPQAADAFIIAVPTPFKARADLDPNEMAATPQADLSYVIASAEAIAPVLKPGNLVVLESTSPPRTTLDIVAPILEKSGLQAGVDFHLAYSPERVLPGQILRELIENARVVGGITPESAAAGRDLYQLFVRGDIICTTATTAEMVKLMENTYRDVNIAIANEFSRLAEKFDIDIWEAIALSNRHPRVEILRPGPGVGGHCISVDPWFLVEAAPEISDLIHTARNVNDAQPEYVVSKIHRVLGELDGKKIAVLGLAYKPDVDDLRESPAVTVAKLLAQANAEVTTYEPYDVDFSIPGTFAAPDLTAALTDQDLIVLLVAHTAFRELTPAEISTFTSTRQVYDTVNVWPAQEWEPAGFVIHKLGVGTGENH